MNLLKDHSVLNLSSYDVFWELKFIFTFGLLTQDIFSFINKLGSLLVNLSINVLFHNSIRVGYLCNNEVKENER